MPNQTKRRLLPYAALLAARLLFAVVHCLFHLQPVQIGCGGLALLIRSSFEAIPELKRHCSESANCTILGNMDEVNGNWQSIACESPPKHIETVRACSSPIAELRCVCVCEYIIICQVSAKQHNQTITRSLSLSHTHMHTHMLTRTRVYAAQYLRHITHKTVNSTRTGQDTASNRHIGRKTQIQ